MRKGANSIIVAAVAVIAIAIILSVGVMYAEQARPYTPYETKPPVRIDVQPLDISAGTFLVENLDSENSVTLSQLMTTGGGTCDFAAPVTLGPDDQAVCTMATPLPSEITFYNTGAQSATVILEGTGGGGGGGGGGGASGWISNYTNTSISGGALFDGFSRGIDNTSDGGYISIGYGYVGAAIAGGNDINMGAVKVDPLGNIMWSRIYGQAYKEDMPFAIMQDEDGNYVMVGAGAFALNTVDAVLVKIDDLTGNILWAMRYDDVYAWHSVIEDVVDKNYVVVGGGNHPGALTKSIVVAKLNRNNGAVIWAYQYVVTGDDDVAHGITQNADNSFIVTGDDNTVTNVAIAMRIPNAGGAPVWTVTSTIASVLSYDAMEDAAGDFLIAMDMNTGAVGGGSAVLMKLSSAGALTWAKFYEAREWNAGVGAEVGGNTRAYNVVEADTGEYILAGQVQSLGGHLIEVETTGALGSWAYRYSDYSDHPLGPRGTTNVQKTATGYAIAMDIEDRLTIAVMDTGGGIVDCTKYSDILADITWADLPGAAVAPVGVVPVDVSAMAVTSLAAIYNDRAWVLAEDCVCQSGGC